MLKRCVFNRLSIGMIPKTYKESLTYEEQLLWLQKYLNNMLEWLTELQKDFDNIDINFDEIESKINEINTEIETLKVRLTDVEYNKADKSEVQLLINNLDLELRELISSEYNVLKEYVDEKDEYLQYQIDHFDIGNIQIYDPTTGLQSPIQTVIDNIYDQTRNDAISAGEFDLLELTASEFDSKEITAFNFDQHGKTLLTE